MANFLFINLEISDIEWKWLVPHESTYTERSIQWRSVNITNIKYKIHEITTNQTTGARHGNLNTVVYQGVSPGIPLYSTEYRKVKYRMTVFPFSQCGQQRHHLLGVPPYHTVYIIQFDFFFLWAFLPCQISRGIVGDQPENFRLSITHNPCLPLPRVPHTVWEN